MFRSEGATPLSPPAAQDPNGIKIMDKCCRTARMRQAKQTRELRSTRSGSMQPFRVHGRCCDKWLHVVRRTTVGKGQDRPLGRQYLQPLPASPEHRRRAHIANESSMGVNRPSPIPSWFRPRPPIAKTTQLRTVVLPDAGMSVDSAVGAGVSSWWSSTIHLSSSNPPILEVVKTRVELA